MLCGAGITAMGMDHILSGSFIGVAEEEQEGHSLAFSPSMEQLRRYIAAVSLEIMQNDTVEEATKSQFIDIGPFVDLVELAIDNVGVRGVYTELFEANQFAAAIKPIALSQGLEDFDVRVSNNAGQHPMVFYRGIPSDRDFPGKDTLCTGCIWWLSHWAGAITADKLLRDGSLRLDNISEERANDAASMMKEIQRAERLENPGMMPVHSQHGFTWHYLAVTRPSLDEYPLDLAKDFCGDLLWKDEWVEALANDIERECRHGFGHAMFHVLAKRQLGGPEDFSVRRQFRPAGGFVLSEEFVCEGYTICALVLQTKRRSLNAIAV
jgi:hypothetical protein